eukprot:scaffold51254_cov17-Tisochrysis_lutea.AAC.1
MFASREQAALSILLHFQSSRVSFSSRAPAGRLEHRARSRVAWTAVVMVPKTACRAPHELLTECMAYHGQNRVTWPPGPEGALSRSIPAALDPLHPHKSKRTSDGVKGAELYSAASRDNNFRGNPDS